MEVIILVWISFSLLIVWEIIIVDLFILHHCIPSRFSIKKTVLIYFLFSIILFICHTVILSTLPIHENGNGILILIEILYLFPAIFVCKKKVVKPISLLSVCFIYTFALYAMSVYVAKLLPPLKFLPTVLIVQTVFIASTIYIALTVIKTKYMHFLINLEVISRKSLGTASIFWFVTLWCFHFSNIMRYDWISPQL